MESARGSFTVICRLHNAGGSRVELVLPRPDGACEPLALEPGETRACEWQLQPEPASEAPDSNRELLSAVVTAAYANLCASGYDLLEPAARRGGQAALAIAAETQALLRSQGLESELVGGLLLLDRPQPHAWLLLAGGGVLDPWLYLALRRHPDFLLMLDLAPEPEVYLGGHEGRRVRWPECPGESLTPPASYPDDSLLASFTYPQHPLLYPAHLLPALRALAFTLLLLAAAGLPVPGSAAVVSYLAYLTFLLGEQRRGFIRLWSWRSPWGRRFALEAVLLHTAALSFLFGAGTVLPQTAYILLWIFNRIELALSFPCKRARR